MILLATVCLIVVLMGVSAAVVYALGAMDEFQLQERDDSPAGPDAPPPGR
jgi:hypothetical protein